jgi:muramoyltetrapeptide carboxypeptidase
MPIRPPILLRGDTIGIVTLGSPLDAAVINQRTAFLRNLGLNVLLAPHVYAASGFLAGSDEARASDFMEMIRNTSVKMILASRGGVGVAGILPFLDFNVIRSNPKIVCGYSDITILLNVLAQYADLITLQSLMLIDFRSDTPSYNFDQFFAATSTAPATRRIANPPSIPQVSRVPGNVTGPLVGGNLTSFIDSLGTPYEIDTRGKILLIEESHEPINTVYRYITHLRLAGKLSDCLGIVMGECTGCESAYYTSYEDLIQYVMVPLGKPLMTNVTTAHGLYKAALPIGATVNLNTTDNTLTVTEPTVQA